MEKSPGQANYLEAPVRLREYIKQHRGGGRPAGVVYRGFQIVGLTRTIFQNHRRPPSHQTIKIERKRGL